MKPLFKYLKAFLFGKATLKPGYRLIPVSITIKNVKKSENINY
jgi:hypothetical protein